MSTDRPPSPSSPPATAPNGPQPPPRLTLVGSADTPYARLVGTLLKLARPDTDSALEEWAQRLVSFCLDTFDPVLGVRVDADSDDPRRPLVVADCANRLDPAFAELASLSTEQGPLAHARRTGQSIEIVDLLASRAIWPESSRSSTCSGGRSIYVVPLRLGDRSFGVLTACVADDELDPVPSTLLDSLHAVVSVATVGLLVHRLRSGLPLGWQLTDQVANLRAQLRRIERLASEQPGTGRPPPSGRAGVVESRAERAAYDILAIAAGSTPRPVLQVGGEQRNHRTAQGAWYVAEPD